MRSNNRTFWQITKDLLSYDEFCNWLDNSAYEKLAMCIAQLLALTIALPAYLIFIPRQIFWRIPLNYYLERKPNEK